MPSHNVLVMQQAQGGKSGQYFGLSLMSWSASALLCPVLGGQLYGHFGGRSVWLVSAALALLSIPLLIVRAVCRSTAKKQCATTRRLQRASDKHWL